jgi:hypothetical protein
MVFVAQAGESTLTEICLHLSGLDILAARRKIDQPNFKRKGSHKGMLVVRRTHFWMN